MTSVPMYAPTRRTPPNVADVSAPLLDREITCMPPTLSIPPELYRRKMAHRQLVKAIKAIQEYRDAVRMDYQVAADAGFYALAAMLARDVKRGDLVYEYEQKARECITEAASARPMRVHQKRAPKRPRRSSRPQPDQSTRLHRPADLRDETE